jgi:hypothetical protein
MSSPLVTANLLTAAALTSALGGPQGTADQWAYLAMVLVNGTDTTGNPLQTPFVPPSPECYGFGTCGCPDGSSSQTCCGCANPLSPVYQRTQQVSATQWLTALRQYQAPAASNPIVTQAGTGGSPGPTTTTTVPPAGAAGTSTNVTQPQPVSGVAVCPAGQTCSILGNGIPDMYVTLVGVIVLGLAAWYVLKKEKAK